MAMSFGPAWVRQVSDPGHANKPPAAQPAHQYTASQLIALLKSSGLSGPSAALRGHPDLATAEVQRPIYGSPLSADEQVRVRGGVYRLR